MKTRELKTKIRYKPTQTDYKLQAIKACRWCWLLLLLLLLPLLLLIPLSKNVQIKVIDRYTDQVLQDIPVYFNYQKRDFFSFQTLGFFTNEYPYPDIDMLERTNSEGIAVFQLRYNVYQWLRSYYDSQDIARAYCKSNCHKGDSTYLFFDLKQHEPNDLLINPELTDIEVRVLDSASKVPLSVALLVVKSGNYMIDSARTDDNGRISFGAVPKCLKVAISASKNGWEERSVLLNVEEEQTAELLLPKVKPSLTCGAFFSDDFLDDGSVYSKIYSDKQYSDYVANGDYPLCRTAFPRAASGSFDAIALNKKTRVIIYSQPHFKGEVVFDETGPLLVYNLVGKSIDSEVMTRTFKDSVLMELFPPSARAWSPTNMRNWSEGSVKVICEP